MTSYTASGADNDFLTGLNYQVSKASNISLSPTLDIGKPLSFGVAWDRTGTGAYTFYRDHATQTGTRKLAQLAANGVYVLGIDQDTPGGGFQPAQAYQGKIAEVIYYDRVVTAAEALRINSYLALKYGITLNQTPATDYVASNGTTRMWTAADNTGYNRNIAGIGRDDCTDLHQKQSKSTNTGGIITMALGDAVAASNPANTQGVTNDMSFLVWAHNNAALTFSTVVTGLPNSTVHTPRIWKTDKTNWGDQNITVCAQGTAARYLLISSDATFGLAIQNWP